MQQNQVYPADPAYPPKGGYGGPPPGYAGVQPGYGQPQGYSGANMVIVQSGPPRPPTYLAFSIVVCLCFNWLLGLIAIILSVLADKDADVGDMDGAREKGKAALGLNIASLVIALLFVIIFPIVWVLVVVGSVYTYG